ncbi:hypothetical protein RvY_13723 [Ramazzottius varieornatus]|uniref:Eclosion hormone n=1 Tax=Ramazzottius varieornatus TaxID=947166 RepID=A0A1D1VR16_RAMVA|nr:hypothetical protein RvY_13723 [Ramazzottius varieornatus]
MKPEVAYFLVSVCLVLCLSQHSLAAPVSGKKMLSGISICITNCAQCHDLVGDIFDHRQCSRDCVKRKGLQLPDCTNPMSIKEYLNLKVPMNPE